MKKVTLPPYAVNAPSIKVHCIDAEQNQRLDNLKRIDEKHDRQFTWTLCWAVFTFLWLLILTALAGVRK